MQKEKEKKKTKAKALQNCDHGLFPLPFLLLFLPGRNDRLLFLKISI